MMYSHPDLLHKILDTNAQAVTAYLNAQIDAGAQAVQIFDTWGGVLSDAAFKEFSLKYIRQIVAGLKRENEGRRVPVIVFAKGGGLWLESMAEIGADALGLDWTCNIGEARRRVGEQVALQATSTRLPSSVRPNLSAPKSRASLPTTATAAAMYSISATASTNTPTPNMPKFWSIPYTNCPVSITVN